MKLNKKMVDSIIFYVADSMSELAISNSEFMCDRIRRAVEKAIESHYSVKKEKAIKESRT